MSPKSLNQLVTGPLQLTPLIESHDGQGYAISRVPKLAQSEKQESLCFILPIEENHSSLNVATESLSLTHIFVLVHLDRPQTQASRPRHLQWYLSYVMQTFISGFRDGGPSWWCGFAHVNLYLWEE